MRPIRTVLFAAILVVALISSGSFALSPVAAAAPQNLKLLEWPVPTGGAQLGGISADSSGRIWFTENSSAKLGLLDPGTNKIYEWGGVSAKSRNIVTGRAGAFGGSSNRIYFAEYDNNRIAFLDNVTGFLNELTEFGGLTGTNPVSVAVDNLGNIWFTESGNGGYIGELSGISTPTSGSATAQLIEWQLPAFQASGFGPAPCNCLPWGIYVNQTSASSSSSPDTYVWFTEKTGGTGPPGAGAGAIGRLQVSTNILTMWDLGASPLSGIHGPTDITVDSSGNVYWTNSASAGNKLSLLANGGNTYKEYALATTSAVPVSPFPDPARKAVWALEYTGNNILYLDTTVITSTGLSPFAGQCTIGNPVNGQPSKCPLPAQQKTTPVSVGPRSLGSATVTPQNPTITPSLGSPTGPFNGLYEYSLASSSAGPFSLFLDANENLWLTESSSAVNRIAEIQFPVDFTIQLTSSSSQTVSQGGSVTYSVSVNPATGLQTPVTLSVNAPSGLSASFNNNPVTPPHTSTLTISTSGSTTPTTYAMSITGTSSSATHSLSITLTVTLTTVTTTATSTTCGFDYQITADQTSQTFMEGDSGSYQLHVLQTCPTATQQPVTLTPTTPTGVTAQLTDNGLTPSYDTQLQVQVAVDAPVTQSATISVSGTSPGGPSHTLTLTLQITAVPRDFSLVGSGSVSLYQASRLDITLTVTSIGYFDGPVGFTIPTPSVSGLGGSVTPNPVTLSPAAAVTTTLEIVAQKGTPPGTYQLTVTGSGNTPQGPVSHDFQVSVTVTSGLPCLIATATFGSPLAPEVQFLRDFRDHQILHTFAGSNFMVVFNAWYYSFSPGVAGYENLHPTVKTPMQYFLLPLLGSLHVSSWTYASVAAVNPEIASLIAGLVGSSLIGLLYLALPLAATLWLLGRKVLVRAGHVKTRLVKFFVASITLMIILFAISELFTLAIPMMIASATIVLLGLAAGSTIPTFELIDRLYER